MNKRNYKCYKIRQKSNKVNIVTNKTEKVSIRKYKHCSVKGIIPQEMYKNMFSINNEKSNTFKDLKLYDIFLIKKNVLNIMLLVHIMSCFAYPH